MALTSEYNSAQSSRSVKRYLIVLFVAMLGCYHLGRWACTVEHQDGSYVESIEHGSGGSGGSSLQKKAPLTMEKIQAMRSQAQKLIGLLDDYYSARNGGSKSILIGDGGWARGWAFFANDSDRPLPPPTSNITREDKLVDTMARALLNQDQDTFIIGVIGSSVAAGHDNCRYDNYENQLHRIFAPVWEAAGMKLEVQNAGQGGSCGDSHKNQVWCVQQNVSPMADIIHYSWSYFEVGSDDGGRLERESLIRWTHLLPNAPPVHVVNVEQSAYCYATDHDSNLFRAYDSYGYNAFCMRYALLSSQHNRTANTDIFEAQHVGDGYNTTTRYGLNETNEQRRDSLGTVLRNWHPGPLGFQLISDALAYTYSTALLVALDRIEAAVRNKKKKDKAVMPTSTSSPEATWWKKRSLVLRKDMKGPLLCDPLYCHVNEAPKCLNLEVPTYGRWGASIVPANDDLNLYKGELQKWKPYEEKGDAFHMINKLEAAMYADTPEFCQFDDHCAAVEATGPENGRLVLKLPKMEVGMVAICVCCGKEVARPQLLENENVKIDFNGQILDRSTWDLYPEKKCVRVLRDHSTSTAVGRTGHSYLSVRLLGGNSTQSVRISHVITI